MMKKLPPGTLDRLWSNPENWSGLGVYNCSADPRIIVSKRLPVMGWTVNFAHGLAGVYLAAMVLSLTPLVYFKFRHEAVLGGFYLIGWFLALVIACRVLSSAKRYEDS